MLVRPDPASATSKSALDRSHLMLVSVGSHEKGMHAGEFLLYN